MRIFLFIAAWCIIVALFFWISYRREVRKGLEDRQRLREANWRAGDRRR